MKHIPDEHQNPLDQQIIFFFSLLPVLSEGKNRIILLKGSEMNTNMSALSERLTSCRRLYKVSLKMPKTFSLAKA